MIIYLYKMDHLRKIIRDVISGMMEPDSKLKTDIPSLHDFHLLQTKKEEKDVVWSFIKYQDENSIYIDIIEHPNETWSATIEKNGKLPYDHVALKWGPYQHYEEMVRELNKKLENNPVLTIDHINNKYNAPVEKEVEIALKKLMKKGDILMSLKSGNLEELKKIYRFIKDSPYEISDDDVAETLVDMFGSYNSLINALNKINQIDYYVKLEKFQNGK